MACHRRSTSTVSTVLTVNRPTAMPLPEPPTPATQGEAFPMKMFGVKAGARLTVVQRYSSRTGLISMAGVPVQCLQGADQTPAAPRRDDLGLGVARWVKQGSRGSAEDPSGGRAGSPAWLGDQRMAVGAVQPGQDHDLRADRKVAKSFGDLRLAGQPGIRRPLISPDLAPARGPSALCSPTREHDARRAPGVMPGTRLASPLTAYWGDATGPCPDPLQPAVGCDCGSRLP